MLDRTPTPQTPTPQTSAAQTPTPHEYMLRVAADEIEFMERAYLLRSYPHIATFLRHPLGIFVLTHVQNFCWTLERFVRNFHGVFARRASRDVDPGPAPPSGGPALVALRPHVRPNIWIDVTNTHRAGFSGGVERAAMKLAEAASETGLAMPVFIEDGHVYRWGAHQVDRAVSGAPLRFSPDIVYVIADSFWQQVDEYRDICDASRADGAKVVLTLHDVIPLYYPSFNRTDFVETFARAFADLIERCDACIASSKYSREKVRAAIKTMRLRVGRPLPLTHFHLGADGHVCLDLGLVRESVRDLFARDHVFLSVGTLEPRKGYAVTLDAFDGLWQSGIDCKLVIIGRTGWISKALEQRILEHPNYGRMLHWIQNASDAELTFAYRNAYCLLQASITEGFGLPIVEANLEGTPVIAADNEIFRELAGSEICYFRNCDSIHLAETIAAAVAVRPRTGRLASLTWNESLTQMVARISDVLEQRQAA